VLLKEGKRLLSEVEPDFDPEPIQLRCRCRPNAAELLDRQSFDEGRPHIRCNDEEAIGLTMIRGELGEEFVVGDTRGDIARRSLPSHGLSPNSFRRCFGPEFIAATLHEWIAAVGSQTAYIEPESPRENGYCESFNSKMRMNFSMGRIGVSRPNVLTLN
jgi:Integrase core domain